MKIKVLFLGFLSLALSVMLNSVFGWNTLATGAGAFLLMLKANTPEGSLALNRNTLRNASFQNYDPDIMESFNNFDETTVSQKRKASFDLVMTNTSTVAKTIELFNFLKSFTKFTRTEYAQADGGWTYTPKDLVTPSAPEGGGAVTYAGSVGWAANGDLVITGAGGGGTAGGEVRVHCNQFPYRGLFESSGITPFRLVAIRMTTLTDAQIDMEIRHFSNSFLGGNSSNSINPRTSFDPNQTQSKIVDVPLNVIIDAQKGLEYTLQPAERVSWNTIIEGYVLNTAQ